MVQKIGKPIAAGEGVVGEIYVNEHDHKVKILEIRESNVKVEVVHTGNSVLVAPTYTLYLVEETEEKEEKKPKTKAAEEKDDMPKTKSTTSQKPASKASTSAPSRASIIDPMLKKGTYTLDQIADAVAKKLPDDDRQRVINQARVRVNILKQKGVKSAGYKKA